MKKLPVLLAITVASTASLHAQSHLEGAQNSPRVTVTAMAPKTAPVAGPHKSGWAVYEISHETVAGSMIPAVIYRYKKEHYTVYNAEHGARYVGSKLGKTGALSVSKQLSLDPAISSVGTGVNF